MSDTIANIRKALSGDGDSSSDFDLNPDVVLPKDRRLRDAAVLVAERENRKRRWVIVKLFNEKLLSSLKTGRRF